MYDVKAADTHVIAYVRLACQQAYAEACGSGMPVQRAGRREMYNCGFCCAPARASMGR